MTCDEIDDPKLVNMTQEHQVCSRTFLQGLTRLSSNIIMSKIIPFALSL